MVVHHVFVVTTPSAPGRLDHAINQLAYTGPLGVDLFFVLSGYLITTILDRTRDADARMKTFYQRRFLRIFPLYYGFLLFAAIVSRQLSPEITGTVSPLWHWVYLTNLSNAIHPLSTHGVLYPHFWSLSVEEHFYLIWPFVVYHTSRKTLIRISIGVFCTSLLGFLVLVFSGHIGPAYVLTPTHAFSIAAGALVAVLQVEKPDTLRRWSRIVAAIAMGFLLFAVATYAAGLHWHYVFQGMIIAYFLFPATIGMLVQGKLGLLRDALSTSLLRTMGKYSYCMYVVHFPIIGILTLHWHVKHTIGRYAFPYQMILSLVIVLVSFGIAFVSWQLWEKQFLKLAPQYRRSVRNVDVSLATA